MFGHNPLMESQNPVPMLQNSSGYGSRNGSPSSHASSSPQEEVLGPRSLRHRLPPTTKTAHHDQVDQVEDDWKFFDTLPPGYRFCPTDNELIQHYLLKKINKEQLPLNQIRHIKLYDYSPDHIAARYKPVGDKEWYFFTPRDRKYRNGDRPNRAAGSGYWKATGADKFITDHKEKSVGCRKALVYYEGKPPKGNKTNWIMHEYRRDTSPKGKRREREKKKENTTGDMRLDDFVLCRIYKKVDKSIRPRPRNAEEVAEEDASPPESYDYPKYDREGEETGLFDINGDFKDMDFMQSNPSNNGFSCFNDVNHHSDFEMPMSYDDKRLYPAQSLPDDGSLDTKPPTGLYNGLLNTFDIHSLTHPDEFSLRELESYFLGPFDVPTLNVVDAPSMSNR